MSKGFVGESSDFIVISIGIVLFFGCMLIVYVGNDADMMKAIVGAIGTILAALVAVKGGITAYYAAHIPIKDKEEKYFLFILGNIKNVANALKELATVPDDKKDCFSLSFYYEAIQGIDISGLENKYIECLPREKIGAALEIKVHLNSLKDAYGYTYKRLKIDEEKGEYKVLLHDDADFYRKSCEGLLKRIIRTQAYCEAFIKRHT